MHQRRVLLVALVALVGAASSLASCGGGSDTASGPTPPGPDRPNVVVIMTDDQTTESLRVMERTQALLADEGTTFVNGIATFPLCCPARSQFLTGQYAHNNGVRDNTPPDGGEPALDDSETLAVWLQRAGYTTAHVGKYLNAYTRAEQDTVPPGWDRWFALFDPTATDYFDYDVNENGRVTHRGTADADYQTDVLADEAVAQVHALADGDAPFYLNFWPAAPHTGTGPGSISFSPAPAPRHLGDFAEEALPDLPAIGESDITDKPAYVQGIEPDFRLGVVAYNLENGTDLTLEDLTAEAYRRYLESLLAVDEAVGRLVDALDEEGVLDDTLIAFVSDNGWSFGEHRIHFAKVLPYENVVRVPFLVRGAGFAAGAVEDEQVGLLDLPATILAATGAAPRLALDGRPLPGGPGAAESPPRALLLESPPRGSGRIPHYDGVRTDRYTYVEYETGEIELYDRSVDPDQLTNLAADPAEAATRAGLAALLDQLQGCAGTACHLPVPAGL
ncbi:MAG: sulfatase [Acidimicrobiales bacterium]|nr:sulfatase [Acidimicrobiales bacterium]